MTPSRLIIRNIRGENGRTSIRLEPELWAAVMEICLREEIKISQLIRAAQNSVGATTGRTSAVRVYALNYFRAAGTEAGHAAAGHGPLK